uniref:Uncharacterized protein n=1 Tax=Chromera velia CCMP2878 TaxID=1169474 RepID=A0A0G4ID85_9ALVE|eukprot:Cvel_13317.t1-p1 / transcript=Cvel_13317.t1 / gene=Cvel_13317 / organism=Chromera_velia_CCMP2878 / gene_product=hypothetical protein / transcript_product=hypothetical protein / location=Cvel_scaffold904:2907-9603(-) / protein_length=486 / sequence_SO=supercontig / SO=protein_coding / is_pseudo=false
MAKRRSENPKENPGPGAFGLFEDILADVPTLTRGEAGELLEWAHTQSEPAPQKGLANSSKSGVTVESRVSTQTSSPESWVDNLTQSLVKTKGTPRQTKVEPPIAHAPPTVAFNTEHCLGGVLHAIETTSISSGLPSPPETPRSNGGGWQIQGRSGRRAAAREERGGSGGGTDALLSVALKAAPSGSQAKGKKKFRVDWSCNMDVVAEMERQRENAHCVCVSMLRENSGTHADVKGFRSTIKHLLRTLICLATGTPDSPDTNLQDCIGVPLNPSSSAEWMRLSVWVRGSTDKTVKGVRGFILDDIGVEAERKILSQVEGLRDLFGGDRVYVSSEDWRVLWEELKVTSLKGFSEIPPMYVRIARGVIFEPGHRTSLSEFDLSKFVPTSEAAAAATGGGRFADRVREYFRMNCHHAAGGGRGIRGGDRSGRHGLAASGHSGGGVSEPMLTAEEAGDCFNTENDDRGAVEEGESDQYMWTKNSIAARLAM